MALPELNTARYTVEIPSTGQTVTYRPYLVKEEKVLMMAMESSDSKMIIQTIVSVIKSCIYDEVDIDSLAMFDIETLFLELRSKSVGEKVDLKIKCEECEHRNEVQINFEDIQKPVIDDSEKRVMLTEDVGVVLKYPALKDVERFAEHGDESIQSAMKMITACIDSIFDADNLYDAKNETVEALDKFLDSLNNEQFTKLSEFFKEMPALHSTISFNCTSCNHANSEELRGLQSFFT